MMPCLQFRPIYQERVWGGRRLEREFARSLPGTGPIGESWEIVDRPEAQSVVRVGPQAGHSLRALLDGDPAGIMGPDWAAERSFPVLVKWLDCRQRLSLQVHPPAGMAAELAGEPKAENWYFARTDPGAAVLAGLKPGVTVEAFAAALHAGRAEECVEHLPVRTGDSLFVPSGVLHAIDAGSVILEIQQNSDTTYRVYDWGRGRVEGRPRALHLRESLLALAAAPALRPRWQPASAEPVAVLADVPEFRITRHRLATGATLHFAAGEEPRLLAVAEGTLRLDGTSQLLPGDTVLLPFAGAFTLTAAGPSVVVVTDRFTGPPA